MGEGYARGKTGVIVRDHGVYLFPDSTRIFRARSVSSFTLSVSRPTSCGEIVSPRDSVHLDLRDDYLE